jgi:hypothetical protein
MDLLSLSTALHSCQNILYEKKRWTFLRRQEVLLSPKNKLSRVVAIYPVKRVYCKARPLASQARLQPAGCLTC